MRFLGGSIPSYDYVWNAFDYVDGSAHSYDDYRYSTSYMLGHNPDVMGGVFTSDIPTIGPLGGMQNVPEKP